MSFLPFMRVTAKVAAVLVFIGIYFTADAEAVDTSALAADTSAAVADTSATATDASMLPPILVSAQNLDDRRSRIQTQTGASTYSVDAAAIAEMPAGDNTNLNQVILQMPDVAQDSFGQYHIRGEHNGLQYRINGVILPEGISVFGQTLDPRFINSMSPIDRAYRLNEHHYRQSVNLIDEGQFGAPIILTPFNYHYGKQYGAEFTANYTIRDFSAYLNMSVQSAKGKQIDSAQYNFSPTDLGYIANNSIHLDHEQQHSASGGVSYLWRDTRFSADFLVGSGLRADLELPPGETNGYGGTDIPNGEHLPYYTQVNTGIVRVFHVPNAGTLNARFDVITVFDKEYEIRNGTGVGVGAPQYGPRRGFFFGLSKSIGSGT